MSNGYQELHTLPTKTINHTSDGMMVVLKERSMDTYDKSDRDLFETDEEESHAKLERIYNREEDRMDGEKMYKLEEEELMKARCKEMNVRNVKKYLDKQIEIYIKLQPINTQEKLGFAYRHLNAQVAKYTSEDE